MLRTETLICGERNRLAEEYDTCVDRFRLAVFALKNLLGAEFDRAYETSEKHRIALEKARIALNQHRVEHRCQGVEADR
jgi:hypothetical protein